MPVNGESIFFTDTLKQVPGYPGFVTRPLRAFRKDLKLSLAGSYLSVDSFDIDSCCEAKVKVLFHTLPAKSITRTH